MNSQGTSKDWVEWHRPYDEPGSALAVRLALVQAHITRALDEAPDGEIRRWFSDAGFAELGWDGPADHPYIGVGAERWPGTAGVVRRGVGFFRFGGDPVA